MMRISSEWSVDRDHVAKYSAHHQVICIFWNAAADFLPATIIYPVTQRENVTYSTWKERRFLGVYRDACMVEPLFSINDFCHLAANGIKKFDKSWRGIRRHILCFRIIRFVRHIDRPWYAT